MVVKLTKSPTTVVTINTVPIHMMIDSCGSTNIIDESAYQQICIQYTLAVTKPMTKIMAYGSKPSLPTVETFCTTLESKHCFTVATIHVVKGHHGS